MQATSYILLALVKVIDNIILTGKTILTQKNKAIASSILVIVSQFIFYFVVKQVVDDNNFISIFIVSVASGIGSYIAFCINKRFSKDTVYVNIITSNDRSKMKAFGDHMRAEGIKIVTLEAYSDTVERTLTALVFANTKDQSIQIDKYVDEHEGFFREVVN
jgi:uncharacterized protein YebE (UPF0316 family)